MPRNISGELQIERQSDNEQRAGIDRMNRRELCRLLVCNALFRSFASAAGNPWKLGVITDQVDLNLERVLSSFFPKYALRWSEIRYLRLDGRKRYVYAEASAAEMRRVRQQLDDAGVRLSVLDTAIYKITLPGTTAVGEAPAYLNGAQSPFPRQLENLRRAADAAHVLGTDKIRIFTFRRVADPQGVFHRVVEELQKALQVAKQNDVTLLVENEYDCNVGTGAEIGRLFRSIPDRRLMHNWDPCNAYEMGEQPFPQVWRQIDHARIAHIHLKDASGKDWKPVGGGHIDFRGQFEALKKMNYSGTMSLETRYQGVGQDKYSSSVESMNGLIDLLREV